MKKDYVNNLSVYWNSQKSWMLLFEWVTKDRDLEALLMQEELTWTADLSVLLLGLLMAQYVERRWPFLKGTENALISCIFTAEKGRP